jgi:hypothetical protein
MKPVRLSKRDLALSQLNHAIALFIEERELISCITLAGAAEEILGKLVAASGGTPALTRRAEATRQLHQWFWGTDLGAKVFVNIRNDTKNNLKHLVAGTDVEIDLRKEAMRMLDRALENYEKLRIKRSEHVRRYRAKWKELHEHPAG